MLYSDITPFCQIRSNCSKKTPPFQWKVEFLCDHIEKTMSHCDLSHRLKKTVTFLRLKPITLLRQRLWRALCAPSPKAMESCALDLSVRDQIGLCFKSAPRVLSVKDSNRSKTPSKTQCKRYSQAGGWEAGKLEAPRWNGRAAVVGILDELSNGKSM